MSEAWPALCTAAALALLLLLILRFKFQAFVALLIVSLALGLAAGMTPVAVLAAIGKGIGDILKEVAIVLALGALLGRMLEVSGAAEVIARTLVNAVGVKQAPWGILVAGYIIGIPVLFNVGFLLLIPIMWRLQRDTGRSLLWFALPLAFSLATTHSLIPPHPGVVGCVQTLGGDMMRTILFGTLMGIPIVLFGWLGPGRYWARRQFVNVPEHLAGKDATEESAAKNEPAPPARGVSRGPAFSLCVLIVTLPLLLSLLGFTVQLLADAGRLPASLTTPMIERDQSSPWWGVLSHPPVAWLRFLGQPVMALLVPTGLAFWLLGWRRGLSGGELGRVAEKAIQDIGGMALLFGAAGGFKQVIVESGAGEYIARQIVQLPLSPVIVAYLTAVLVRMALGSATAAILTASALLAGLAEGMPGQRTLLVLAVANGVTFMTQPGDTGFWLIKEYCNLSVKEVLIYYNACRASMSLLGLGMLLLYQMLVAAGVLPAVVQ